VTNTFPHWMRQAARKPAIMQMRTFWINVACIGNFRQQKECHCPGHLPETPLAIFHDPKPEQKICNSVGHDTRRQAFRPICDAIVECARNESRNPIRSGMGKPEPDRKSVV